MPMMERPAVTVLPDGGKTWEHTYELVYLKAYVPANKIDGQTLNYGFRAPLLLVFEEQRRPMAEAVRFAEESGLARIAAAVDSSVLFVYPTCEGGWADATEELYRSLIAETKIGMEYRDGIVEVNNFFTKHFDGYFIRGAIFRADIYSFGASADYVARCLLKTLQGEYLWGPGEITPAMCSMQGLSVIPTPERKDIGILSVGNSDAVNAALAGCRDLLIREKADYEADFASFVRKFKMWCGNMEYEPDFDAMGMKEVPGSCTVRTLPENMGRCKGTETHKVGWFAYYNRDLFDHGPVPLVLGFHGGGDSSMYLTFVAGWYEIAHRYGFLFVSLENHLDIPAGEVMQILEELKKRYPIDEHRIYASGFSMGSGKSWELFQQFPETFAGLAPCSALFPVKNNPFAPPIPLRMNDSVPVPLFYSGGEASPLPELPCHADTALDRFEYALRVNGCRAKPRMDFENRSSWEDPYYGIHGDREEQIPDESRGSVLTVRYFDSEDGVCRTAFASVSGQQHECRHHSIENAWKFISRFTR